MGGGQYTPLQYAQGMVVNGTIRVGTLYRYWKEENPEIGDSREGFAENFGLIPDGSFNASNLPHILQPDWTLGENVTVDFTGIVISSDPVLMPEAYIYCTTVDGTQQLMRSF